VTTHKRAMCNCFWRNGAIKSESYFLKAPKWRAKISAGIKSHLHTVSCLFQSWE